MNMNLEILTPDQQNDLFGAIEQGLPIVEQPYLAIANQLQINEEQVLATITAWQEQGLIRRFGLVVRHRKLGYQANAMVVWDIEDDEVARVANILASEDVVTLCYQRPRVLPQWHYNLFCMIHGKSRDQVLTQLADICQRHQLDKFDKNVLFSTIAYKQRGGKYSAAGKGV
jgi:DNA-binding Lrp family transcriptional regulator